MSSDRPHWYRRRIVIVIGAVVAVLTCAAAVFALTRPGDVFNPDVEFRAEPEETFVPTPVPGVKPKKKGDPLAGFAWAQYGYSRDRRRYLPAENSVRPPFRRRWSWSANSLLEFPPIIVGNRLFTTRNDGVVVSLNRTTGKQVWKQDMGYLAASSPAYGEKKIYVTILERTKGVRAGRVAAIWAKSGKVSWSKPLPSRSESSPMVVDHRLFFGTEDGTVYAMRTNDGERPVEVPGAAARPRAASRCSEGKLYFGTYGGHVYAIGQRSGKQVWHAGTSGATFGLRAGNFYATPAVAFGRVYIGNTDGNMYSFSAASGKLAWRRKTGSYVYASPAVAQVPGTKPTVYFGSYDGTFYALDARTGGTRWTYRDGGKISGAATVVGDLVYYSNWGHRNTSALWAKSGTRAWKSERGAFNPVVSDGQTIYVTGFSSVAAFEPMSVAEVRAAAERRAKKLAAKKKKAVPPRRRRPPPRRRRRPPPPRRRRPPRPRRRRLRPRRRPSSPRRKPRWVGKRVSVADGEGRVNRGWTTNV